MAENYYANYRLLAGAIVAEQCREYYEIFRKAVNSPDKRRRRKAAFARYMLLNHSYGSYLDLDMDAIVSEIERKAIAGEEIKWKGEYGRKWTSVIYAITAKNVIASCADLGILALGVMITILEKIIASRTVLAEQVWKVRANE